MRGCPKKIQMPYVGTNISDTATITKCIKPMALALILAGSGGAEISQESKQG